jgi:hypothetical protein
VVLTGPDKLFSGDGAAALLAGAVGVDGVVQYVF